MRKRISVIITILCVLSLMLLPFNNVTAQGDVVERRAVVENVTGLVTNVVAVALSSGWSPPSGSYLATQEDTNALGLSSGDIYTQNTHTVIKPDGTKVTYNPGTGEIVIDSSGTIPPVELITPIVDWRELYNTPKTLAGYGITDTQPSFYARVTESSATTSSLTLVDITGMTLPLSPNSIYEFEAILSVRSSSTAGNKYGIGFSSTGATVEGQVSGTLAAATSKFERISALSTLSTAFVTLSGTGAILMKGIIATGTDTGNLTVKHAKVTSGTSTVFTNSFLRVCKIM